MDRKEKIKQIKSLFVSHGINHEYVTDELIKQVIEVIQEPENHDEEIINKVLQQDEPKPQTVKMELMINVEGICNEQRGKNKRKPLQFGLDCASLSLSMFLKQVRLLGKFYVQSADVIMYYDSTALKTGSRGFIVTRDAVFLNKNGYVQQFRFFDMDQKIQLIKGHKKDVFRIQMDEKNIDIKLKKDLDKAEVALEVFSVLYQYSRIVLEEKKKR